MAFDTRVRALGAAVLFAFSLGIGSHRAVAREFYRLESALTLKSPHEPDWDYLAFDASRSYLFISRRDDGVLVYDVNAKKPVTTLEQSEGGNATALVPEFDRGYVIKEDGTGLAFSLSTLKPIEKLKFGASADNGFYDPVTKQLLITMGDEKLRLWMRRRARSSVPFLSTAASSRLQRRTGRVTSSWRFGTATKLFVSMPVRGR